MSRNDVEHVYSPRRLPQNDACQWKGEGRYETIRSKVYMAQADMKLGEMEPPK